MCSCGRAQWFKEGSGRVVEESRLVMCYACQRVVLVEACIRLVIYDDQLDRLRLLLLHGRRAWVHSELDCLGYS